jgi:hypothetical protein
MLAVLRRLLRSSNVLKIKIMKKKLTLFLVALSFLGNAQCPAPSDCTVTAVPNYPPGYAYDLNWTENGDATSWEMGVDSDYVIGNPLPTQGFAIEFKPYFLTNIIPTCNVFYIRSVCSSDEVSPWTLWAVFNCSQEVNYYISTLSNTSFNNQQLLVFPNPTNSIVNINNKSNIKSVALYDTLGRLLVTQELNQSNFRLDISNQNKGVYFLKIVTENGSSIEKIVKE